MSAPNVANSVSSILIPPAGRPESCYRCTDGDLSRVGDARAHAERGHAGQFAGRLRHERCAALVPRRDERNRGFAVERIQNGQELSPGTVKAWCTSSRIATCAPAIRVMLAPFPSIVAMVAIIAYHAGVGQQATGPRMQRAAASSRISKRGVMRYTAYVPSLR